MIYLDILIGDGCIWEGISPMHDWCLVSQSVLSSFKCSCPHWSWCCLKKMWRNNISFKKETEKIYKWKAWYKLLSSSGLKKIFAHVSIIHTKCKHPLECGGTCVHEILCTIYCAAVCILKREELTIYISLKESKLACFTNS